MTSLLSHHHLSTPSILIKSIFSAALLTPSRQIPNASHQPLPSLTIEHPWHFQ
ncbi:hypothetical protein E2C01_084603 [Portunus trituberculatus]|uniref:Uncharacterized protein n=1 Tax=Portunus trituberculatus TaxID=210409 RepID=A0A5B7J4M8_PORTR|nr:hypothetical protein [Portunus trituberculatus]